MATKAVACEAALMLNNIKWFTVVSKSVCGVYGHPTGRQQQFYELKSLFKISKAFLDELQYTRQIFQGLFIP